MSRPATQQEADRLSQYLCQRFHGFRVRKSDLPGVKLIEVALNTARALGADLISGEDFVEKYATTIGPTVFVPDGLEPDQQMELMVHEIQHVHQFWTGGQQTGLGGNFTQLWLYTFEPEARVRYEVEAYRAQWEWLLACGRAMPNSIEEIALPLEHGYMLNDEQKQFAKDLLEVAATTASKGIVSTEVATAAIDWTRQNIRELLTT